MDAQVSGVESLLVVALAVAWVAARLVERLRRARADLRGAVQAVAALRTAIPALAMRVAAALAVLALLLLAAGTQG